MDRTKRIIAQRVGITVRHLDYVLTGQKNPGNRVCERLESVTGIDKVVWRFGSAGEKGNAFMEFLNGKK